MSHRSPLSSTASPQTIWLPNYTKAGLPAPGTLGRLAVVTDNIGGIWKDNGPQWRPINGGIIDVTQAPFNADPTGATDSRSAIALANTAATTSGSIRFTQGTYKVSSNITISAACIFENGAILSPDGGVTVTLSGPLIAGFYKIFTTGAGTINIAASMTPYIIPQWWGAVGNYPTDESAAFVAALAAAAVESNRVYIRRSPGYGMGTTGLTIPSGMTVFGDGSGSTVLIWDAGFSGTAITVTGNYNKIIGLGVWAPKTVSPPASTAIGFDLQGPINELHDVRTDQTSAGNNSPWYYGVKVTGIQNQIMRSHFYAYDKGITGSGASNIVITGNEIISQITAGIHLVSAVNTSITDNDIEGSAGGLYGILMETPNEIAGLNISGNYFESWTDSGIKLTGTGAAGINGAAITGNSINLSSATNAIKAEYTDGLVIKGNYLRAATNAINLATSNLNFDIAPNYIGSGVINISGTATPVEMYARSIISTASLNFYTSSSLKWQMDDSGNILPASTNSYDIGGASNKILNVWTNNIYTVPVATGSLPAAGAGVDGLILIEDAGTGDRNLIIYAGTQRFRIDGGAAF